MSLFKLDKQILEYEWNIIPNTITSIIRSTFCFNFILVTYHKIKVWNLNEIIDSTVYQRPHEMQKPNGQDIFDVERTYSTYSQQMFFCGLFRIFFFHVPVIERTFLFLSYVRCSFSISSNNFKVSKWKKKSNKIEELHIHNVCFLFAYWRRWRIIYYDGSFRWIDGTLWFISQIPFFFL